MKEKIDSVCIVDDDEVYRFVTNKEIELTNLVTKIIEFPNGERAIAFFKSAVDNVNDVPDIIFLDVNMPVMDGWQFLEQYLMLKPILNKQSVIYMVSSSVDNRDMDRAKKINEVNDYIIKPISRNRLSGIFTELLNK